MRSSWHADTFTSAATATVCINTCAHTRAAGGCSAPADPERACDRVYLLWAENSRKLPLAPSLLLQYWLAVSMQPDSYRLQVLPACGHPPKPKVEPV